MKQCNANRKRNKLVNFWVTPDEIALIETRVKLTGLAKGEYLIETLLLFQELIKILKKKVDVNGKDIE